MTLYDLDAIGHKLHRAQPIVMTIKPSDAFTLVCLLRLVSRHPRLKIDTPDIHHFALTVAKELTDRLGQIDPAIIEALNIGWDEALNTPPEGFDDCPQPDPTEEGHSA